MLKGEHQKHVLPIEQRKEEKKVGEKDGWGGASERQNYNNSYIKCKKK